MELEDREPIKEDRVVKGIWIPIEIWDNETLSMTDKHVYAEIDSFCGDGKSCFAGNEWLAQKLHISESSVRSSIAKLKKMELVEQVSFDGRKRYLKADCHSSILRVPDSGMQTAKKQTQKEDAKSDNYIENKELTPQQETPISTGTITDKNIYSEDTDSYKLASYLFKKILERNPGHKQPNMQQWCKHVDLMLRIDKRDKREVAEVIAWCQQDSFWQNNILSTAKLRQHFDQLNAKRKTPTLIKGSALGTIDKAKYERLANNPPKYDH